MNLTKLISGALLILANLSLAIAQNYPTKPVSLVVPYPAGGVSDVIARIVSPLFPRN